MKAKTTVLEQRKIEKCGDYFRTLSHPHRIKIIDILTAGPKCVGDIQKALKIAQPPTSHHLKLMTKIGVLKSKRDGKNTFYSLVPGIVDKTVKMMEQLAK